MDNVYKYDNLLSGQVGDIVLPTNNKEFMVLKPDSVELGQYAIGGGENVIDWALRIYEVADSLTDDDRPLGPELHRAQIVALGALIGLLEISAPGLCEPKSKHAEGTDETVQAGTSTAPYICGQLATVRDSKPAVKQELFQEHLKSHARSEIPKHPPEHRPVCAHD